MITTIIFDADGVLVNGEMFNVYLERDYNLSIEATKEFFTGIFRDCVEGKADLKKVLPPYLQKWGINKSVDEFIHYWHTAEHTIDEQLVAYIQDLRHKGIVCCLGTNQTKYRFEYMLKEMNFENCFDKVYASAHLGHRKPNQGFYAKIINDLKISNKKEVLFWDDSEANIIAAKEFGINGELYTDFENFKNVMEKYQLSE